jgi:hypothetical protein
MYYAVMKPLGSTEVLITFIEGDRPQVLAKLKTADPGMEVLDTNVIIIAGEMYFLRPAFLSGTASEIRERLCIPEPVVV